MRDTILSTILGATEGSVRMRVAVLGLGEAGSIYAADLARRGVDVAASDPAVPDVPAGVTPAGDTGEAVRGADLVLSLVGGALRKLSLRRRCPRWNRRAFSPT